MSDGGVAAETRVASRAQRVDPEITVDLAYAPSFGPTLSPVIGVAGVLANEFEKETEGVQAME